MVVPRLGFRIVALQDDLGNFAVLLFFRLTKISIRVHDDFTFFDFFIPLSNYVCLDLSK